MFCFVFNADDERKETLNELKPVFIESLMTQLRTSSTKPAVTQTLFYWKTNYF